VRGTVKWFSRDKGYGFIAGMGGIRRHFHVLDTRDDFFPKAGNFVLFDETQNSKGPRAVNIRINPVSFSKRSKVSQNGRISCPECGMAVVPRMVLHYGRPYRSLCPFCGGTVREFASRRKYLAFVLLITIGTPFCNGWMSAGKRMQGAVPSASVIHQEGDIKDVDRNARENRSPAVQ
jgi:cold shock CspA family protein